MSAGLDEDLMVAQAGNTIRNIGRLIVTARELGIPALLDWPQLRDVLIEQANLGAAGTGLTADEMNKRAINQI